MPVKKYFRVFFVAIFVATVTPIIVQPAQAQSITFECQPDNDTIPTTYAITPEGAKPVIKWKSNHFSQSSWTPIKRCQKVTERFNTFSSQNMIDNITAGWLNREPVICVTSNCSNNTLLFTLRRSDQDPEQVIQELFANRQGASTPTVQSSGGSASINLQNYLDQTPVETTGNSTSPASPTVQSKPGRDSTNTDW
jgi:Circadian oscillating protein COP23